MNLIENHKKNKFSSYWEDLNLGTTGKYKFQKIDELINNFLTSCPKILDIGCGTDCKNILRYKEFLGSEEVTYLDYDEEIVKEMQAQVSEEGIKWKVANIINLKDFKEKSDLIFVLDVLHEIYSFYGRPSKNLNEPVNHELGIKYVSKAIKNLSDLVNVGGGIIITDDVLTDENNLIEVKLKNKNIRKTIDYFFDNYPSKKLKTQIKNNFLNMPSRDLCTLLTQYNKIKKEDWKRWNVERLEVHQYMSPKEYQKIFSDLGFDVKMIVGTPQKALEEWKEDFEIKEGFPNKRITLLALKKS